MIKLLYPRNPLDAKPVDPRADLDLGEEENPHLCREQKFMYIYSIWRFGLVDSILQCLGEYRDKITLDKFSAGT
jgi:hypothetical protein